MINFIINQTYRDQNTGKFRKKKVFFPRVLENVAKLENTKIIHFQKKIEDFGKFN